MAGGIAAAVALGEGTGKALWWGSVLGKVPTGRAGTICWAGGTSLGDGQKMDSTGSLLCSPQKAPLAPALHLPPWPGCAWKSSGAGHGQGGAEFGVQLVGAGAQDTGHACGSALPHGMVAFCGHCHAPCCRAALIFIEELGTAKEQVSGVF